MKMTKAKILGQHFSYWYGIWVCNDRSGCRQLTLAISVTTVVESVTSVTVLTGTSLVVEVVKVVVLVSQVGTPVPPWLQLVVVEVPVTAAIVVVMVIWFVLVTVVLQSIFSLAEHPLMVSVMVVTSA